MPLTLTVASGEVSPATVRVFELTVWSPGGKVTSSFNSSVCGIGVGLGVGVDAGVAAVEIGATVAVGEGVGLGVGVGTEVGVGLGVAVGSGVAVARGAGVATTVAVGVGDAVAGVAAIGSWPPHEATSRVIKNRPRAANGNDFAGKATLFNPTAVILTLQ